jgi:hypothetical protein
VCVVEGMWPLLVGLRQQSRRQQWLGCSSPEPASLDPLQLWPVLQPPKPPALQEAARVAAGDAVSTHTRPARPLLQHQGARDADANAMVRLAKMYLHGQGCQQNIALAQEWVRKARCAVRRCVVTTWDRRLMPGQHQRRVCAVVVTPRS